MSSSVQSHFATAKEVAKMLNVSPSYVYNLLRKGNLPGVRIGNCWRVDLRRLGEFVTDGHPNANIPPLPSTEVASETDLQHVLEENQRLREIVAKQRHEIEILQRQRV